MVAAWKSDTLKPRPSGQVSLPIIAEAFVVPTTIIDVGSRGRSR